MFFKKLFKEIKDVTIPLYKILIPFVFIIKLLEIIGAIDLIARVFEPLMSLIGLPAEFGIIWVTAIVVNIYAALILFVNLLPFIDVSVAQITILTVAMLFAHNLAVESAISRSAGVSFLFTIIFRLISAFLVCWILNLIYTYFNYLNQPYSTSFTIELPKVGLIFWLKDQAFYLFYIFIIVVVLVTLLEVLKLIGVENLLKKILVPPLRFFGISDSAMNIVIVGMTMGLQFGGGILIKEVNSGKIDKQSVFLSILMINLIHAVIEDTLLMLAVGGHYSGVIFARIIFSLVISLLMLKIYQKYNLFFEKYVFNDNLRSLPVYKKD
ncbi:nucleoside recognition protein [Pelagibacteraceae bacterium]|nr:nucleoside recognition protein [Pelagibacteraceae bacterium]